MPKHYIIYDREGNDVTGEYTQRFGIKSSRVYSETYRADYEQINNPEDKPMVEVVKDCKLPVTIAYYISETDVQGYAIIEGNIEDTYMRMVVHIYKCYGARQTQCWNGRTSVSHAIERGHVITVDHRLV